MRQEGNQLWEETAASGGCVTRAKKKYRLFLICALIASIMAIFVYSFFRLGSLIPNEIILLVDEQEKFDFQLPLEADIHTAEDIGVIHVNDQTVPSNQIHLDLSEPFTIQSSKTGSYQVSVRLFGVLRLKDVSLDVIESIEVIPCGTPIGITVKTDGILVLGTGPVACTDGQSYEPALNILKTGDYIIGVNGKEILRKDALIREIQATGEGSVILTVRRDEEEMQLRVDTVCDATGDYKIGVWVRDDTQGIGTLTFVTTTGDFGALGHGITDVDTGLLMEIGTGEVYGAEIVSIVKGRSGTPGELSGIIHQSDASLIGQITTNTAQGIFGKLLLRGTARTPNAETGSVLKLNSFQPLPLALKQEIEVGPATILSFVDGTLQEYKIEIEKVDFSNSNYSKGLVLRITDERLIAQTGGIVQGMSGSPILQNGKLVGAVTHVFVRDATRGYGTFIENMLKKMVAEE